MLVINLKSTSEENIGLKYIISIKKAPVGAKKSYKNKITLHKTI
ncbi:hypothetical protein ACFLTE_00575 [Bacteroidota bacterium]